jgi:hypothetical protein
MAVDVSVQFAAGLGSSEATVGMNLAACHHFGAIGINTSRGRMKDALLVVLVRVA